MGEFFGELLKTEFESSAKGVIDILLYLLPLGISIFFPIFSIKKAISLFKAASENKS